MKNFLIISSFLKNWIHNNLNNATVFNNYSAKDKFIKRGFKSKKIFVIQNAIMTDHIKWQKRNTQVRNKDCYSIPLCKTKRLPDSLVFL